MWTFYYQLIACSFLFLTIDNILIMFLLIFTLPAVSVRCVSMEVSIVTVWLESLAYIFWKGSLRGLGWYDVLNFFTGLCAVVGFAMMVIYRYMPAFDLLIVLLVLLIPEACGELFQLNIFLQEHPWDHHSRPPRILYFDFSLSFNRTISENSFIKICDLSSKPTRSYKQNCYRHVYKHAFTYSFSSVSVIFYTHSLLYDSRINRLRFFSSEDIANIGAVTGFFFYSLYSHLAIVRQSLSIYS